MKDIWKVLTIIEIVIIVLLVGYSIYGKNQEIKNDVFQEGDSEFIFGETGWGVDENKLLCSIISGTPAWTTNGKVLQYGLVIPENMSIDLVGASLIPGEIKFLYSPTCSICEKQIEYFKEQNTWNQYVESGLTVDCSQYW